MCLRIACEVRIAFSAIRAESARFFCTFDDQWKGPSIAILDSHSSFIHGILTRCAFHHRRCCYVYMCSCFFRANQNKKSRLAITFFVEMEKKCEIDIFKSLDTGKTLTSPVSLTFNHQSHLYFFSSSVIPRLFARLGKIVTG